MLVYYNNVINIWGGPDAKKTCGQSRSLSRRPAVNVREGTRDQASFTWMKYCWPLLWLFEKETCFRPAIYIHIPIVILRSSCPSIRIKNLRQTANNQRSFGRSSQQYSDIDQLCLQVHLTCSGSPHVSPFPCRCTVSVALAAAAAAPSYLEQWRQSLGPRSFDFISWCHRKSPQMPIRHVIYFPMVIPLYVPYIIILCTYLHSLIEVAPRHWVTIPTTYRFGSV